MYAVTAAHARAWGFGRMASVNNPKASKATKYGYLNAILYMAPADSADGTFAFNLCANAGGCKALCLGRRSGQAAIREGRVENAVTTARAKHAIAFMRDRAAFMDEAARDVARLSILATKQGLSLCYHFNGSMISRI